MNDIPTFASGQCPIGRQAAASPRHGGHFNLSRTLAVWRERVRFRRQLEDRLMTAPHLIDDMGLTIRQAEAEIARRFWQA